MVVAVACADAASGYVKSSRQRIMVPCAAASASKLKASEPGRLVVVTITGVAAAVRTAVANLLIDR